MDNQTGDPTGTGTPNSPPSPTSLPVLEPTMPDAPPAQSTTVLVPSSDPPFNPNSAVSPPPNTHWLSKFADPTKTGRNALILGIVSLFIFGWGFSLAAIIYGIFGIMGAVKFKSGKKALILNISAILVGIVSQVLLTLINS